MSLKHCKETCDLNILKIITPLLIYIWPMMYVLIEVQINKTLRRQLRILLINNVKEGN